MDKQEQLVYSVEYEMAEVVFYQNVSAYSFDDAKRQIRDRYTNVNIRAVSIIEIQSNDGREEQQETKC
jgi:hypothetical protein